MKNIEQYKKRFFNLMESELGNVKPLINEQVHDDRIKDIKADFGTKFIINVYSRKMPSNNHKIYVTNKYNQELDPSKLYSNDPNFKSYIGEFSEKDIQNKLNELKKYLGIPVSNSAQSTGVNSSSDQTKEQLYQSWVSSIAKNSVPQTINK